MAISMMAAMAAFISVVAAWRTLLVRDPMAGRAKSLRRRREELKAGLAGPVRSRHRQLDAMNAMRGITHKMNLLRTQTAGKAAERLAQAGWRSRDAAAVFLGCKVVLPFVFGGAAFLLFNIFDLLELEEPLRTVVPMGGVLLGAYAPEIFVRNTATKRHKAITKGLPDALDLLVVCAEAGLALDGALTRVSREMARAAPEVADEFAFTALELGFLPERRKALDNLARRVPLASVRGVVNTLTQTEKYGTPLANSLRVLAGEFRNERMLKAEDKAAKLPAILTVPLIVFILPTLFIVLLGPAILQTIDGMSGL